MLALDIRETQADAENARPAHSRTVSQTFST
jgi:hypothetical protein